MSRLSLDHSEAWPSHISIAGLALQLYPTATSGEYTSDWTNEFQPTLKKKREDLTVTLQVRFEA